MSTFVHLKILQISVLSVSQDWFAPSVTFNVNTVLETKPHGHLLYSSYYKCNVTELFVIIQLIMTSH